MHTIEVVLGLLVAVVVLVTLARRLMSQLLETERRVVVDLRDRGVVSDDVLHRVQRDLDLEETRLQAPLE